MRFNRGEYGLTKVKIFDSKEEKKTIIANNLISSVNATRWVENVQNHFKRSYPKDEYILLGNDQLVGVCLAIFIRRDLASFVKYIPFQEKFDLSIYSSRNIAIDTVKTGMGGKLGNKGCVSIVISVVY